MDYFKLAEAELKNVSHSSYTVEIDKVRIAKAEVYARLAHAQVLREANNA